MRRFSDQIASSIAALSAALGAGCVDPAVELPLQIAEGDWLIFAKDDQVSVVRARETAPVGFVEGASLLRVPGAIFVDELGRPLSAERATAAGVFRGTPSSGGLCGRCLGSPRSDPIVVHDGDFCPLPAGTEVLEGPDVRDGLMIAWPGTCECDIPEYQPRAGSLRWRYLTSADGYEAPHGYGLGPAGEVATLGVNELRLFGAGGRLAASVRRLEDPLSCDGEPVGPDLERYYGVVPLSADRVVLFGQDAPGDKTMELWASEAGAWTRLGQRRLSGSPSHAPSISADRAILIYERGPTGAALYEECSFEGDEIACHEIDSSLLADAHGAPLLRAGELYAVHGDDVIGHGLLVARRSEDGWDVQATTFGEQDPIAGLVGRGVGLGRGTQGAYVFLCADDGSNARYLRAPAPARGTAFDWIETATFELIQEELGECEGFASSESGPAYARTEEGWLSLGDSVERLPNPPGLDVLIDGLVGDADRTLAYSPSGYAFLFESGSISLVTGPEMPASDVDYSASAVRGDEVWLFGKTEARVVSFDPLAVRTVRLAWNGPSPGRVRGAVFVAARDLFVLAGGDIHTATPSGWVASVTPDGRIEELDAVEGGRVLDVAQTLEDRFVLITDDARVLEWSRGELSTPVSSWDDPETSALEEPPPPMVRECESRRPGDRGSALKALSAASGSAWVAGCGGLVARVHPGFVERVWISDGSDFTTVQAYCADAAVIGARDGERGSFSAVHARQAPAERAKLIDDVGRSPLNRFSDAPVATFVSDDAFGALFVNSLQLMGLSSRVIAPPVFLTAQAAGGWIVGGGHSGVILVAHECP